MDISQNNNNIITLNDFSPRWYQKPILDAIFNKGYKRIIAVMPRRSGKDYTLWQAAIRQCLMKTCMVYYVLPNFGAARRSIWDAIDINGQKFLDMIPLRLIKKINSAEMKITFVNDSILLCIGGESHATSIRGTNPYAVILSEFAYMDDGQAILDTVMPILAANNGWLAIASTPYGKNHYYQLFNLAKTMPGWFVYYKTVEDTKHIPQEALDEERNRMSEGMYNQEYECFPSSAGVLTSRGVIEIRDIKQDDMVVTHTGRNRKVTHVMSKHYQGLMYRIKSYGSSDDIICTPEHPLRVYHPKTQSYEWKPAQHIQQGDFVVFPKYQLPKTPVISYELCMLMAWFITEGSGGLNNVRFALANQSEVDRVIGYLIKLGYDYEVINTTCVEVNVNSTTLLDFLKVNCGTKSYNKRIPLTLIAGYEKEFFYELIRGDGCHSVHKGHERYIYTTVSESLAYQIQILAHSIEGDLAAGITTKDPGEYNIEGRTGPTRKAYSVQIYVPKKGRNRESWMRRAKNSVAASVSKVTSFDYDDLVYNLSVQFDESYIVYGRAVHNCSFDMGVDGSIFGAELQKLKDKGQITSVAWDPGLVTYLAIDIGVSDATTIVWFQVVGDGTLIRVIDCYSNTGKGLDHYAKIIQDKPYRYSKMFAPHDLKVREWGGGALTRYEKARQLDLNFTILDQIPIADSIENALTHFPKMWIDKDNCRSLIDALENYHREYDPQRGIYKNKPVHDKFSNYADAFRYMCQAIYKTRNIRNADEYEKMRNEALYGKRLPKIFQYDPRYDR